MLTTKRAAFYGRISDADDAIGVDRQKKLGLALIDKHDDWELVAVLVDNNRSAKDEDLSKRPDYQKLLAMIGNQEVDIVVAYHGDRISRNGMVIEQFLALADNLARKKKHPIIFHPVRGNPCDLSTADGQKAFRDTGSSAIHESAHKAERVRERIDEQVDEGMRHGGVRPYGTHRAARTLKDADGDLLPTEDENGNRIPQLCPSCGAEMKVTLRGGAIRAVVEPCPIESERIRYFVSAKIAGTPLYSIARHANDHGWPTAKGYIGRWTAQIIFNILKSSAMRGARSHNGQIANAAAFTGVLTVEEHDAVLSAIRTRRTKPKAAPTLLGGLKLLRCGNCRHTLQHSGPDRKGGNPRYACPSMPLACGRCSAAQHHVDKRVVELLFEDIERYRADPRLKGQINLTLESLQQDYDDNLAARDKLSGDFYGPKKRMTDEFYDKRYDELTATINALAERIDELRNTQPSKNLMPADDADLEVWWSALQLHEKKAVLNDLCGVIWLAPVGSKAGSKFRPERVTIDPKYDTILRRLTENDTSLLPGLEKEPTTVPTIIEGAHPLRPSVRTFSKRPDKQAGT